MGTVNFYSPFIYCKTLKKPFKILKNSDGKVFLRETLKTSLSEMIFTVSKTFPFTKISASPIFSPFLMDEVMFFGRWVITLLSGRRFRKVGIEIFSSKRQDIS